MILTRTPLMLITLSVCLLPAAARAAVVAGYTPETNDRFTNDPSFIANQFDLSGVALNASGRWLTMISPNVYLSAYHFPPAASSIVTFYASNDPAGLSVERTVTATSQRIGTSDLFIGTINTPLPSSFTYYAFATQVTNNTNTAGGGPSAANAQSWINSPYYLADAYLVGRSPAELPVAQDMVIGRNKLDGFQTSINVSGTVDHAITSVNNQPADGNFLPYELSFQTGDSGAPMFVANNGTLTLVGINWFVGTIGGLPNNGYSYVGNHAVAINEFLAVHSVPEPATATLLLACGVLCFVSWRRRSR
jgi:hypothetical protein